MPYNREIPDAPIALSMLPRLTDLQDTDLIYVVVGIDYLTTNESFETN